MPNTETTATDEFLSTHRPEEWLGFATSAEAWAAMRLFTEAGHMAGYPSLKPEANGLYSVRVRFLRDE